MTAALAALILVGALTAAVIVILAAFRTAADITARANTSAADTIARAADYTRSATLGVPAPTLPPPAPGQVPRDVFGYDPTPGLDYDPAYDAGLTGMPMVAGDEYRANDYAVAPGEELVRGLAREDPPWT